MKEHTVFFLKIEPCRFCIEQGSSTLQQQKDAYPLERLLPDGFNPFDGQGVKQRRCVEGEVFFKFFFICLKYLKKIVNRHDCARFMECVDGDWFNLACPNSHFFSTLPISKKILYFPTKIRCTNTSLRVGQFYQFISRSNVPGPFAHVNT